jgi:hypothetical protein
MPVGSSPAACRPLGAPLMKFRSPSEYLRRAGTAVLVWRSLHVLGASAGPSTDHAGPRGLPGLSVAQYPKGYLAVHPRSYVSYRVLPSAGSHASGQSRACTRDASREVCGSFSTVHPTSPLNPGLPHLVSSAFRVSHPLDGLLLERATRPCFMPKRSWSSDPSELFPRPEP